MVEKANKEKAGIRVKDPQKYEYAYLLYMQKVPQKEIAERVGVSQQTLEGGRRLGVETRRPNRQPRPDHQQDVDEDQ